MNGGCDVVVAAAAPWVGGGFAGVDGDDLVGDSGNEWDCEVL